MMTSNTIYYTWFVLMTTKGKTMKHQIRLGDLHFEEKGIALIYHLSIHRQNVTQQNVFVQCIQASEL